MYDSPIEKRCRFTGCNKKIKHGKYCDDVCFSFFQAQELIKALNMGPKEIYSINHITESNLEKWK